MANKPREREIIEVSPDSFHLTLFSTTTDKNKENVINSY